MSPRRVVGTILERLGLAGRSGGALTWRPAARFGEFLQDQLRAGSAHVTVRRMFGGAGVYCDGLMFGLVSDDTLYFRVDDGNRGGLRGGGLAAFTYDGKGKTIAAALLAGRPSGCSTSPRRCSMIEARGCRAARRVAAKTKSKPRRARMMSASPSPLQRGEGQG